MEASDIWANILIPLIIGPICAYLMTLRNDYVEREYKKKREKYEEERDTIFNSLKTFYWPIYLNLLCIQQYSYSLPIKNKFRYESESSVNNSSESNDFYINDSNSSSNLNSEKNAKILNKKTIDSVLNLNEDQDLQSSDDVEITIPINTFNDSQNLHFQKKKNMSMSIKRKTLNFSNQRRKKTIILDKSTVKMFEDNLNKKYKEKIKIIEENMPLVCIYQKLNIHAIDFIRFAKMREIIHEGSTDREYTLEYFGVQDNLDLFIFEINEVLTCLNKKYKELLENPV